MERRGDSIIIHIARNKDQSFFSWLAEVVGAATYGVYSYGRDATIGVAWALSFLYPKDWESSQEAAEVAGMIDETFYLLRNNLDKALTLLLIRMQMDTRGKMFIQMAARMGTGFAVSLPMLVIGIILELWLDKTEKRGRLRKQVKRIYKKMTRKTVDK